MKMCVTWWCASRFTGKSHSDPHVDCPDCRKSVCDLVPRCAECSTFSTDQVEVFLKCIMKKKSQEACRELVMFGGGDHDYWPGHDGCHGICFRWDNYD